MTVKTIMMNARRLVGVSEEGKKYDFLQFAGEDKNGNYCYFKFTKDVKNKPIKEGYYQVDIEPNQISKDKKSKFNVYWVRKINQVVKVSPDEVEVKEDEDLPF